MKYIKITIIGIITFLIGAINLSAAASISTNTGTVYVNNSVTVTVTVTGAAAWEVHIGVSGAASASNCGTLNFADSSDNATNTTKTYSATCKPTKTGSISFNLTGNTTDQNGKTTNISGTKTVNVINVPVTPPTPNNPVTPKSSVNYLKTLSIDGFEISPKFNKETGDYTTELPAGTTKINLKATAEHNKASVSGTGNKEVTEGMNIFKIVVTAENGSKRTYTIKVTVKEKDPIEVTIKEKQYTVIRKRNAMPEASSFYKETTIKINEEEIPAYEGEITGYILVGLKDETGKTYLFVYNEKSKTYTLYKEYTFGRIVLYPQIPDKQAIPSGFIKSTITIDEQQIDCYKSEKNEQYIIIYGMNIETKNIDFYKYDSKENTLQIYDETITNLKEEEIKSLKSIIIGLLGIILIIILAAASQGTLTPKKHKTKKIDSLEEEVNKEDKKEIKKEKKQKQVKEKKKKNKIIDDDRIDIDQIDIK